MGLWSAEDKRMMDRDQTDSRDERRARTAQAGPCDAEHRIADIVTIGLVDSSDASRLR